MPELGLKTGREDVPRPDSRAEHLTAVGYAFRRADRSLRRLRGRDTHLGPTQIGHARFELLGELWERGPLAVGELAAAAGLSAATVSQMVDHLEESGHVARTRSEADRRIVLVELTARGRKELKERRAVWRKRWRNALRDVDSGDLQIAAAVLERIADVFDDPRG
ncbi:MAG TPA: MarR family transcriptional regulator [Solirubrobacterales bacterium]|nr:MarR family transcriptional regulator [Solirubrobacterales bacterium]